jgi:hypothetical protein
VKNRFTTFVAHSLPTVMIALGAGVAHATCGSDFCSVNTHWDTQGIANSDGMTLDIRYSAARANRLRAGSSRISPASPSGSDEEIEDKRTVNRVINIDADYAINARWNIALGLPVIIRDHAHTFDSSLGGPFEQQARFTALGDIRVVGKYKLETDNPTIGGGIRFGLKLPTGAIDKTMTPPDPANPTTPYRLERAAQPGSGSTDLVLGLYRFGNLPVANWGWFVSGQLQAAIKTRDGFRPGQQTNLDLGVNHELSPNLFAILQLNLQHRARDAGVNASVASGGYSVNLSPGLAYALTHETRVYGFVQKALRQYVNGDPADPAAGQLTAPWSFALGVVHSF